MSRFDLAQMPPGAHRERSVLMMPGECLGMACGVDDDDPRFVERPVRDGLRWQRLRS